MEENSFEPTKPNNKTKIILIICFILILVGAFGYFKYFNNDKKQNNEETKNTKTIDEKNLENYPYYYIVTARYAGTEEYKQFIDKTFGTNAEERYRNYFQWYNVVHELTHGLISYNSNMSISDRMMKNSQAPHLEEIVVNDFAVAYWKKYGEPERIQMLKETVDYILSNLPDPTEGKMTYEEYGKKIMTGDSEPIFEEYGWFQFTCVKHALESDLTLEEAYKKLGLAKEVIFDDEKLSYASIDEEVSDKVINDTVSKFKKWGLNYSEIYHQFDNDPNNNFSSPINENQYRQLKAQEQ